MSTQAQSNPTPVTSPCHSTLEFLKIKTTGEKLSKRLGHSIPAHVTTIAQLPWQPHTRKQDVTAGNNSSPIYRTLPSELTGRRQTCGCVPSSSAVSQLPASWPCSWKNTEMVSDTRALRSPWTALPVVTGHRASLPGKPRRAAVGALRDEAAPALSTETPLEQEGAPGAAVPTGPPCSHWSPEGTPTPVCSPCRPCYQPSFPSQLSTLSQFLSQDQKHPICVS